MLLSTMYPVAINKAHRTAIPVVVIFLPFLLILSSTFFDMVASRRAVTWKHSLFFLKKQSLLISKTKQSNPFYLNNTITTAWNIQYIFFLCFPYLTFEISHVLVFSILLSALSHFFALSSEPPVTLDGSYWDWSVVCWTNSLKVSLPFLSFPRVAALSLLFLLTMQR